ncbi:MAG TPA: hypothetical protein VD836_03255 [Solirubrobacteraceae bacterium]|nr:hypothetical protein [Solirubrobacteraceae bacterium]
MRRHVSMLVLGCAATLAMAAPATADTYRVAGKQVPVDAETGLAAMRGGLIGNWATTSFELLEVSPLVRGRGTESFEGCLNRNRRDRSCKGDPAGTLAFTFEYLGAFASPDPASLIWGSCLHPIVSGTGAFAGAQGVIAMVDMPTPAGVVTRYEGTITLASGSQARKRARAATAARPSCGAS